MEQLPFRGLSVKSRRAFASLQPCLNQVPWSEGQVSRSKARGRLTVVFGWRLLVVGPWLLAKLLAKIGRLTYSLILLRY